jgi:hypothetical protein
MTEIHNVPPYAPITGPEAAELNRLRKAVFAAMRESSSLTSPETEAASAAYRALLHRVHPDIKADWESAMARK